MSTLFAFLHHLTAFAIVSALVLELVLLRSEPSVRTARTLMIADAAYGASAGILLVVGLLRVFYFEKGAYYYFHSLPFIVKLALFVVIGLLSIYPTREFVSWRKALKAGKVPVVSEISLRRVRSIVHYELIAVVLLILCAALMARGVAYLG